MNKNVPPILWYTCSRWLSMFRNTLMFLVVLGTVRNLFGATFIVGSVSALQPALDSASSNGQNDTIQILPGTYSVSATLSFVSAESQTLTITGELDGSTILASATGVQIMNLIASQAGAHLSIEYLTFQNAQTTESGGGLAVDTSQANISLLHCLFQDNEVTANDSIGGGAALVSEGGTISVESCSFLRNHSNANVGGLYAAVTDGLIRVSDCVIQDNTVTNTGGSTYFGDGGGAMLYTDSSGQVQVTGCAFQGNQTSGGDNPDGGGLMVYQLGTLVSADVSGNSFSENTAGLGGGGCFIRMNGSGDVICSENTFNLNAALFNAGGGAFVYVDSGTVTMDGNTFQNNTVGQTAEGDGGGLWVQHGSGSIDLSNNQFFDNRAYNNGAGASIYTENGTLNLTTCLFVHNTATAVGGGLSLGTNDGDLTLIRNTFFGNTATEGAGAYGYFESPSTLISLVNLIFWSNSPDNFAYGFGTSSPAVSMAYSDVEGGSQVPIEPWYGTGCIDQDPLFVDSNNDDFHLSWLNYPTEDASKSPCIDSGDPSLPLDSDGSISDMGAFTYSNDFYSNLPNWPTLNVLFFVALIGP